MKLVYLALVVAVELGGAFGSASATVESLEATVMLVDLEVEVMVSAQAVVAHLAFEDDATLAVPLLDRGGGLFGIRTELEPKNYNVVFEAVGAEDGLSRPVSLTELGADLTPDVPGVPPTTEGDGGLSSSAQQFGWLALALGAASLSALAFWVLGGRDKSTETADSAEEE
jgi:hypothetical protein